MKGTRLVRKERVWVYTKATVLSDRVIPVSPASLSATDIPV
mgnify:FL=1